MKVGSGGRVGAAGAGAGGGGGGGGAVGISRLTGADGLSCFGYGWATNWRIRPGSGPAAGPWSGASSNPVPGGSSNRIWANDWGCSDCANGTSSTTRNNIMFPLTTVGEGFEVAFGDEMCRTTVRPQPVFEVFSDLSLPPLLPLPLTSPSFPANLFFYGHRKTRK